MTALTPLPATNRWTPTRAGLVALWRYWDETFVFHGGRLLLRGPNGSGKSMALELLLPFLLDGDTNPARLTSAARSRGRLFDRVMTGTSEPTRTGYAWVEFRRGEEMFTVGARMRASQSTGKVDVDLFTTDLAVGRELHLLDGTRTPLSRKALVDAIGDRGRVHRSADEHRAAVREQLFAGFDADRYESVIGALLALRKEKLSQNLDLDKLSAVLSEALPPIDEHDIAAVAEGFERLDRRKAELAALARELDEVRGLGRRQRDYARAVVVGVAGEVRAAESRRDQVTRTERIAREALEEARGEQATVTTEREALAARQQQIAVDIEALKDSHAYREGANLADLRRAAAEARRYADEARRSAQDRERELAAALAERDEAAAERDTAAANLERADRDLTSAGGAVGGESALADARAIAEPDDAERFVRAWETARRRFVSEVRAALDDHDRAMARRQQLEERVADDEARVDERRAAVDAAVDAAAAARAAYHSAIGDWVEASEWIGTERLAAAVAPDPGDPATVAHALSVLTADLRAEEAADREQLRSRREGVTAERDTRIAERRRWEQPGAVEPDRPPWRTDRAGRAGGPLWRLVDVVPGADPRLADGLEAALAASGLVDAWVQPDGGVDLGPGHADVVLVANPVAGPSLTQLLAPARHADTSGVPDTVVAEVLASVAIAAHANPPGDGGPEVVVGTDGSFRLGNAAGRAEVRPATLLGTAARERHRLARLADIDDILGRIDRELAGLDAETESLDRRRAAVDAELAAQPDGGPVDEADAAVTRADAAHDADAGRLAADRDALRAAEDGVRDAVRRLTAIAARHGLPADRSALDELDAGLRRLTEAAAVWARRRHDRLRSERQLDRAITRAGAAEKARDEAGTAAQASGRAADEAQRRVVTLETAIGAEYQEVLRRITDLDTERSATRDRARALEQAAIDLAGRVARFDEQVTTAVQDRQAADEERAGSHGRFVAVLRTLAPDADIDVDGPLDTATDILAAARSIAAAHDGVDTDERAIERLSDRVNERVHQARGALGGHVDLDRELTDDNWWTLRTTSGGVRRSAAALAEALATQLDEGTAELAADEERLFEQTLAGSVRRALADRIRRANSLVDAINEQLGAVRTAAAGVHVRLRWEVDPDQPPAVKAARALLLRDPADLSDTERGSLQDFVRARVDQARAELHANASWEARLRETLDYRAWHRFTLLLAHRDWEGFQPATARRLQKLSTGERSVALHLPMIASVAAHYAGDDGTPNGCPRLILLDELFAGVDAANRAQLFGTFTTWDLDAVFTSDHEWCQYATLDGIAIHHLHPPTGDEPVTSTRFTWDGARRSIDPAVA